MTKWIIPFVICTLLTLTLICSGCLSYKVGSSTFTVFPTQTISNNPQPLANPNFIQYTDTLHGFSIQYPKQWTVHKPSEGGGVVFTGTPSFHNVSCQSRNATTTTTYEVSATISHLIGVGIVSLRQFPDAPRDFPSLIRDQRVMQSGFDQKPYEILSENYTTIDNQEAYRVEILASDSSNVCNEPAETRMLIVVTKVGENIFAFLYTGSPSTYFTDYDIAEQSLQSLKLYNTTTGKPIQSDQNPPSFNFVPVLLLVVLVSVVIVCSYWYLKNKRKPVVSTSSSSISKNSPSQQNHHDVFVSYAQKDKVVADAACAKLESHNIRCWISPRDVSPGENFPKAIIDGIEGSKIMVLIFSSNSNNSQHVIREITAAVNKGLIIIPFRIENIMPTKDMEYLISTPHWLDAITPPLEKHLETLASSTKKILSDINPGS